MEQPLGASRRNAVPRPAQLCGSAEEAMRRKLAPAAIPQGLQGALLKPVGDELGVTDFLGEGSCLL